MVKEIFCENQLGRGAQAQGDHSSETTCRPSEMQRRGASRKTSRRMCSCLKRDACTIGGGHAQVSSP